MIAYMLYLIVGILELIVGLRFVFRLIGANASNSIVSWVYDASTPFVAPFSGILGQDATVVNGIGAAMTSVFDWPALIALLVYAIIVGLVGSMLYRRRDV